MSRIRRTALCRRKRVCSSGQEAETNGLPLCYAKYLLRKRYVYIEAEIG